MASEGLDNATGMGNGDFAMNGTSQSQGDDWPDPPNNREDFLQDLQTFHHARGTTLDPNPKVHGKPIDLFELFQNIVSRGGYDKVSAEKLLWRRIAAEFNLNQHHAAASAFGAKTVYYKNLAAYAIKRIHKQEPPPPEILEEITAKGGDLLSRNLQNFRANLKYDQLANGHESENTDDDTRRTPKLDRAEGEEPPSGERRSRGLRQAPPQRVLFQPDVSSSRQPRQVSNQAMQANPQTPIPPGYATNPALMSNGKFFNAASYDQMATRPLTLRGLPTPNSDPIGFQEKARKIREAQLASVGRLPSPRPAFMAPGTGFNGPNIYFRTLMALRSGVPQEQEFALHHLVKISHERGDKFKFDAFIGFAEGLIEKALEVASLFYDVKWEISYAKGDELNKVGTLDGVDGTPDVLDRIAKLPLLETADRLESDDFARKLKNCAEAGLVLRNMSMLEENAKYLANEQIVVKDLLSILLNLPDRDCVTELKHDALDIAEQLTKFWILEPEDPLYISLLRYLDQGRDRGASLTALRAICRISLELEDSNRLQNISVNTIETLMNWTLLDDEELVTACLDFFYQYTAISENMAVVLNHVNQGKIDIAAFIGQLGRLLMYDAHDSFTVRKTAEARPAPVAEEIPEVPQELLEQLCTISEPERSSSWLRCCFEEDEASDVTQIKLWQAYQARFSFFSNPRQPLLQAADFIKNISQTFTRTSAQVLTDQSPPKFIIKGIRPRRTPIDLKGRAYMSCLWATGTQAVCGTFFQKAEDLFVHIIKSHIGVTQDPNGKWEFEKLRRHAKTHKIKFNCEWAGCKHFAVSKGIDSPYKVGMHVKTHMPDHSEMAEERSQHNTSKRRKVSKDPLDNVLEYHVGKDLPAEFQTFKWQNTLVNQRGEAAGLPLTAVLVLRNIARTIPKAVSGTEVSKGTKEWLDELFGPLMERLWHVAAYNKALMGNIWDLVETIEKGKAE